ncbi:MAG: multifunctional CCA tRNA nucleotidyl transferase/2'3'-cyclic phosphodiesterase/2'nucleotidase/phosphatase [Saezia sp.]
MKVYLVGGAVRDCLLGLPVQDRDWVVVGSTPQQMLDAGYKPVGKDFPVFLHPQTHEEVALARTERKTGKGYAGFAFYTAPTVTLEEDLARRDLTINAIAQDENGALIDPYHGQQDLQQKILRHVTKSFAEDPVRILRVARFAARYDDFSIAPETRVLMQQMVNNGEVDALVAERIWQELAKGFLEKKPSRMFEVLQSCGALARILPEVALNDAFLAMLDKAASLKCCFDAGSRLSISFSLLAYAISKEVDLQHFCQRLRVPSDCKELLILVKNELSLVKKTLTMCASDVMDVLSRCDAVRQPQRFKHLLQAVTIGSVALQELKPEIAQAQKQKLLGALDAVLSVKTAPLAEQAMAQGKKGAEIGRVLDAARLQQLEQVWSPN